MSRRLALLAGGLLLLCATPLCAQNPVSEETYGAGVHAFFSGDCRRAYDLLTSAITTGANDPRAFYFRGLTLLRLGREDEAKQDFAQGAKLEAKDVDRTQNVPKALERVQGAPRLMLERYRAEARILAFQRAEELRKARYEALRRDEARVLQQQAEGAPGVKPVPAPIEKQPPAPGPEPGPAGKEKVAPPPTEPEANPLEPVKKPAPSAEPGKEPAPPAGPAKQPPPPTEPAKQPAAPTKAPSGVPAPDETDLFAPIAPGAKKPAETQGTAPAGAGPATPGPGTEKKPADEDASPFEPAGPGAKAKSGTKESGLSTKTPSTKKTPSKTAAKGAAGDADSGTPFIPDSPSDDSGAGKKTGR